MTLRVITDMDVGIDDALALFYLAALENVEIVAVGSVHGNVDAPRAAQNALRVLERCGLAEVPVAEGAGEPLSQPLRIGWKVHGWDGLGDFNPPPPQGKVTGESASDQLIRLSLEAPGELDLLAVGPLTNLAQAYLKDDQVFNRFKSIVVMGGSGCEFDHWGQLTVDANTDYDPEAADIVYANAENLVMVGVNLEPYLVLASDDVAALETAGSAHSEFVWEMLRYYMAFLQRTTGKRVVTLWDPLAAAVLADPSLIKSATERAVDVVPSPSGFRALGLKDRRSEGRFDPRPSIRIVNSVDSERMIEDFIARITNPIG